ncbi:hypothetical protein ACJX0J_022992, partial [Zea mays]
AVVLFSAIHIIITQMMIGLPIYIWQNAKEVQGTTEAQGGTLCDWNLKLQYEKYKCVETKLHITTRAPGVIARTESRYLAGKPAEEQ